MTRTSPNRDPVRTPEPVGRTVLGYRAKSPWLWLADLDHRAVAPGPARFPRFDSGISTLTVRRTWIAAHSQKVWRLSKDLEGYARSLCVSSTCVPAFDDDLMWVDGTHGGFVAIDGDGAIQRHTDRGRGNGVRLGAETLSGLVVISDAGVELADPAGHRVDLLDPSASAGPPPDVIASTRDSVAWVRSSGTVVVANLEREQTVEVEIPEVHEWNRHGGGAIFSPSGRELVIAGEIEEGRGSYSADGSSWSPARSAFYVIDCVSGQSTRVERTFRGPASYPLLWSSDGKWLLVGPGYERNRIYGFTLADPELRCWKFKSGAVSPMLDVTGSFSVDADS